MPRATDADLQGERAAGDARLRVRLFGEMGMHVGGVALAPPESKRARSLLGFLVLEGDVPHARARLAFSLWPDSTEAQAKTNLRKALHGLRREHPELVPFLQVTPQTLQWRRDERQWSDVDAFDAALRHADAPAATGDEVRGALRSAVDLYAGDLLDGCDDEWLIERREHYRDRYVAALRRLSGLLADIGDTAGALRFGREVLRREPFQESSYRALMRLHASSGDRAAAVRVYHECVSTLRTELGVGPSAETVAELTAVMDAAPAPAEDPAVAIPATSELVGREPAWSELTRRWREAESGRSQLVVVTGEAGIGKTRLVEELATWCAHRGAAVAIARSYATEGELGYGAVLSLLRCPDMRDALGRLDPHDAAALAPLLKDLAARAESTDEVGDDAQRRRRLFEATARVLLHPDRPSLLIIDDAQWCDQQSLQLLHYLVRVDAAGPTLVVATVRTGEADANPRLAEVVSGLHAIERATEIELGRLARAETEAIARSLSAIEMDVDTIDRLHAESEGNPLFIVECVRAGWTGDPQFPLSPKLKGVIDARARQLSGPARTLVDAAVVVGREFRAPLVAAVVELDDLTLVRALDELWRRGIVREHGTDAYDFSHGKIRDVLYEALSPATRRRTHRLVAEALLMLNAPAHDAVSGDVARHYDLAGSTVEALGWYRRAAEEAQRRFADAEAVRLLGRAHQLVANLPDEQRPARELDVLSALAIPLAASESFTSPRLAETQQRVLAIARSLDVQPNVSVLRSVALSHLCANDFERAADLARQLQVAAQDASDASLLLESHYLLAVASFWAGEMDTASDHFRHAVDQFDPARRSEHLVRFGQDSQIVCLGRLGNTLRFLGRTADAWQACDTAVARAADLGHPPTASVTFIFACYLALDLDEPERFREFAARLRAVDHDNLPYRLKNEAMTGYCDVLDGRPDRGIQRIRTSIDQIGAVNPAPGFRAALMRLLVAALHTAGHADLGLAAADQTLGLDGTRIWDADVRRLRADLEQGRTAPAPSTPAPRPSRP